MKINHTIISICLFSCALFDAFGATCPTGSGSGTTLGAAGYNCTKTSAYYPVISGTFYSCTQCNDSNASLTSHLVNYGCDIRWDGCECNNGYYGTNGNCTRCPEWTGVYTNSAKTTLARGTTTGTSAMYITECYVATGTYYDQTGTFKISRSCQYQN